MKILHRASALVAAVVLLQGCYTVKSVVDKDFHVAIKKVYVQSNSSEAMKGFLHSMGMSIVSQLRKDSITSQFKEITPLTLDSPAEVQKEIDTSGADVILTIGGETKEGLSGPRYMATPGPGGGGMWFGGGATTDGSEIQVAMYVPHRDRAVWKATVSISTGGWGAGNPSKAADEVIEKLKSDGVLPATIEPGDSTSTQK